MSATVKILAVVLHSEFVDAYYDIKKWNKYKRVHARAGDDRVMEQGSQLMHFCASNVHNKENKHHLLQREDEH